MDRSVTRKGRGAGTNRAARYLDATREAVDDGWGSLDEAPPPLRTTVTEERPRTVISRNASPDVPFDQSINPYRGCEHGCVYCFARPTHAYMDLSPGLDFESRLFAKPDAPVVLRRELAKPGYRCKVIAMGTNTDPYQPIERKRGITRAILEVLADCRHPVAIVTKSALIERDLDILGPMAEQGLAEVGVSVTSLDRGLTRRLEPRAAAPERRLETIACLARAGIPTGVMVAPLIPALNDAEMERILERAAEAGASWAAYILLRLPLEVKDLFEEWLAAHAPLKAGHVMSVLRQTRAGRNNDPDFGRRMTGSGVFAETLAKRFQVAVRRLGLDGRKLGLDTSRFRPPRRNDGQMELF